MDALCPILPKQLSFKRSNVLYCCALRFPIEEGPGTDLGTFKADIPTATFTLSTCITYLGRRFLPLLCLPPGTLKKSYGHKVGS